MDVTRFDSQDNAAPRSRSALFVDPNATRGIPGAIDSSRMGTDRYKATLTLGLAAITGTYEARS